MKILNILLYVSEKFSFNTNKKIMSAIRDLKTSERFIGPLFWAFILQRILNEQIAFKDYTWMQAYYDVGSSIV